MSWLVGLYSSRAIVLFVPSTYSEIKISRGDTEPDRASVMRWYPLLQLAQWSSTTRNGTSLQDAHADPDVDVLQTKFSTHGCMPVNVPSARQVAVRVAPFEYPALHVTVTDAPVTAVMLLVAA